MLVALALITMMMASLGTYYVGSMKTSRYQAQIQAATRIAQVAMEAGRGYGGPTLLVGRAQCTGSNCYSLPAAYAILVADQVRFDGAVTGVTPTVPLPAVPELVILNSVKYQRYTFVGKCWQVAAGGLCGATVAPVAMVRLLIGVTWSAPECPGNFCVRTASALFSADPSDPVFTQ